MSEINIINKIEPTKTEYYIKSQKKWDLIAKPLNGLGEIEKVISTISSIKEQVDFKLEKKALIIMCADNGIVAQGVSQAPPSVTSIVVDSMANKTTPVCLMAKYCNVDKFIVDIGVDSDLVYENIINKKISKSTNDFTKEVAIKKEDVIKAINIGIDLVKELKEKKYDIIATGEMGIGNTTTSSAIASIILNKTVEEVTGKGAGLSDHGLLHKINVIKKGLELHKPIQTDPIDILSKVGGLDIAGLTGVFLGAAYYKIPVINDGLITSVAALLATMLNVHVKDYIIASHKSKEPASLFLLEKLNKKSLIDANLKLGEGTGAIAIIPLIEMGLEVYSKMPTFSDNNIETYKKL